MSTAFAIITTLVSLLTPIDLLKAEFCQAMGGTLYDVDKSECVIVTVHTTNEGEQVTYDTYVVEYKGEQ